MPITISGNGVITGPVTVQAAVGQTEPNITLKDSSGATTATLPNSLTDAEALALLGL